MNKSQQVQEVSQKESRTNYTGTYQDFASLGKSLRKEKPYSQVKQFEQDPYNKYQNILYKRAMFGIKIFTQDEVKAMHPDKVLRIEKVNKRAQREVNIFKQERLIEITNKFFSVFTKSKIANDMLDVYSNPDPKFTSRTSLKDLGIPKEDIINRLCEKGILPRNFDTLK
jgi:hypothetical protein